MKFQNTISGNFFVNTLRSDRENPVALRPQLRAAVRWYISECDIAQVESARVLESLLCRNNKGV